MASFRRSKDLEQILSHALVVMPSDEYARARKNVVDGISELETELAQLDKVPLIRSVTHGEDGYTVEVDLRDGTTRSFQTKVSWLEETPTRAKSEDAKLLRENERLTADLEAELKRANDLQKSLSAMETQLLQAQARVEEFEREGSSTDAQRSISESIVSTQLKEERARADGLVERVFELELELKRVQSSLDESAEKYATLVSESRSLIVERDAAANQANSSDKELADVRRELEKIRSEGSEIITTMTGSSLPVLANEISNALDSLRGDLIALTVLLEGPRK